MFLHLSVILFTGGGGVLSRGEYLCPGASDSVQRSLCLGGLCPGGSLRERPPYGNVWVVRILLEWILDSHKLGFYCPHHLMIYTHY